MVVAIPSGLREAVELKAAERRVSVEQLVQEALDWYLRTDAELLDELNAWQEVRDEALQAVEGPPA